MNVPVIWVLKRALVFLQPGDALFNGILLDENIGIYDDDEIKIILDRILYGLVPAPLN